MIKIIELTDEYIICEKPPSYISESDAKNSLPDALSRRLAELGLRSEVYTVHRLDRGVGGIMIYARNADEAARLSAQMQQNKFHKEYTAVVHGKPEENEGEMTDLLFYDRRRGKTYVVDRKRAGVKEARLSYSLLAYNEQENISLVRIVLHTGRTHQIRAQFSSRKMPLCGDRRYGGSDGIDIALRCTGLRFENKDGKEVEYTFELEDSAPWTLFN